MAKYCPYCCSQKIRDDDGYILHCDNCNKNFNEDEHEYCKECGLPEGFCPH